MTASLAAATDGLFGAPAASELEGLFAGKSCVVVGPGIGVSDGTRALVRALVTRCPLPLVIDADGLNCLAHDVAVLQARPGPTVLTPHPGEMSRLIGTAVHAVQADRLGLARQFAAETGACVALKGARTVIAMPDGSAAINLTGNPGMASGGMGDVLAGVIGALCAQGLPAEDAATLGVYLHGMAADLAAADRGGEIGLIASDVIGSLPRAIALAQVAAFAMPGAETRGPRKGRGTSRVGRQTASGRVRPSSR
jgi:NAD(P)H-hydrate epimerase